MSESANVARAFAEGSRSPAALRWARADGGEALVSIADAAVQRLVGVGLLLESAADVADGALASEIQRAADELDGVIRDIRTAAFGLHGALFYC